MNHDDIKEWVKIKLKTEGQIKEDELLRELNILLEAFYVLTNYNDEKLERISNANRQYQYMWRFVSNWYWSGCPSGIVNLCKTCSSVKEINDFKYKTNVCKRCTSFRYKQLRSIKRMIKKGKNNI
jgi:hypothetical protein